MPVRHELQTPLCDLSGGRKGVHARVGCHYKSTQSYAKVWNIHSCVELLDIPLAHEKSLRPLACFTEWRLLLMPKVWAWIGLRSRKRFAVRLVGMPLPAVRRLSAVLCTAQYRDLDSGRRATSASSLPVHRRAHGRVWLRQRALLSPCARSASSGGCGRTSTRCASSRARCPWSCCGSWRSAAWTWSASGAQLLVHAPLGTAHQPQKLPSAHF